MKKQQGFTLIELVIVVIILGLLGAAAVPRFLDATDDARDASVEGVAGGFASAVGLVRAEWELAGRPGGTTNISYDGISIDVSDTGYPSGNADADDNSEMVATDCQFVFNNILQSSPTSILAGGADYNGERYVIRKADNAAGTCQYILAQDIELGSTVAANYVNNAFDTTDSQGFVFSADSGQVTVIKN